MSKELAATENSLSVPVMGIPFSKRDMQQTVDAILQQLHAEHTASLFHVVTANPEIVMAARENKELHQIMQKAGLITADGIGVVWAAKQFGTPLPERVPGFDLVLALLQTAEQRPFSVYLLGASEEANQRAAEKIKSDYPAVEVAGRRNGFYTPEEEEGIAAEIKAKQPDLLLVALGCPKQEQFIAKYRDQRLAKVAIGVGGTFDGLAGIMKRAPLIWQKLNLEWLHRLLSQPTRWRRQLVLVRFVFAVRRELKNLV